MKSNIFSIVAAFVAVVISAPAAAFLNDKSASPAVSSVEIDYGQAKGSQPRRAGTVEGQILFIGFYSTMMAWGHVGYYYKEGHQIGIGFASTHYDDDQQDDGSGVYLQYQLDLPNGGKKQLWYAGGRLFILDGSIGETAHVGVRLSSSRFSFAPEISVGYFHGSSEFVFGAVLGLSFYLN